MAFGSAHLMRKVDRRPPVRGVLMASALVASTFLCGCSGQGSASAADAASSPTDAASARQHLAEASTTFVKQVQEVSEPCDDAAHQVGAAVNEGDPVTVSGLAQDAKGRCKATMLALGNMKLPEALDGDQRAKEALDTCQSAAWKKEHAFADLVSALDSERPSDAARFRQNLSEAKDYDDQCQSQMQTFAAAADAPTAPAPSATADNDLSRNGSPEVQARAEYVARWQKKHPNVDLIPPSVYDEAARYAEAHAHKDGG